MATTTSWKSVFANPFLLLLGIIAAVGIVFRFSALESVPPGIFVDEQAGMANALCLLRNGTSIYGRPWPLYFQALGGFYDPIFVYSEALFAKLFGASIASFRLFTSLCLLSACFGTAALARLFWGREGAIIALVTSIFCPWSFHAGRLVWGSGLVTAFLPWGLYFLFRSAALSESRKASYGAAVLSGLFLAASASLYRPANAVVILLLGLLCVVRLRPVKIPYRYIVTTAAVLIICGIPNIIFLAGSGWNRVDNLSIFGKEHLAKLDGLYSAAFMEMFDNFGKLLSWDFLFVSGDAIYRHTPASGALGWPEAIGFACLALLLFLDLFRHSSKKFFRWEELVTLVFCAAAIIIGLFPAAQSWDSNPHALRANAAWPFFVLLATAGLTKVFRRLSIGPIAINLVFAISAPLFLSHYFLTFPKLSESWFDIELSRSAKEGAESGDWSRFGTVVKDYGKDGPFVFPMMYEGMDCPTAMKFVEDLRQPKVKAPARVTIDYGERARPSRGARPTLPAQAP